MGRHYLKDEAQTEEDPTRPPGGLGKKISRLANSNECVRRRAGTAKVGSEPGAFTALQKDCENQNDAIEDQYGEKKRVNH